MKLTLDGSNSPDPAVRAAALGEQFRRSLWAHHETGESHVPSGHVQCSVADDDEAHAALDAAGILRVGPVSGRTYSLAARIRLLAQARDAADELREIDRQLRNFVFEGQPR